jgi:hypothetical protein
MTDLPPPPSSSPLPDDALSTASERDTGALPPPPVPAQAGAPNAPLCTVGDIAVTQTRVITPNGQVPLEGTTWIVTHQTTMTQATPPWAIVLAIIFALACLLGLLFLLVKEQRISGFIQVTVQRDGFYHATQVPISMAAQVADVEARVNYIRFLASQAAT